MNASPALPDTPGGRSQGDAKLFGECSSRHGITYSIWPSNAVNNPVGRNLWVPKDLGAAPRLLTHPVPSAASIKVFARYANRSCAYDMGASDSDCKGLVLVIARRVRHLLAHKTCTIAESGC